MTRSIEITTELNGISPELARLEAVNPYKVPTGYFDTLAEEILIKIKAGQMVSAKEEIESLSPILSAIGKNMPYEVPEGYFTELPSNIRINNNDHKGARIISLPASKVFRYAVAAAVTGLIAIAAWFFMNEPAVRTDEIAVQQNGTTEMQVLQQISNISDSEIAAFVERGPVWYNTEIPATTEYNEDDILLMLADVSDQELEAYMRQHNPTTEKFN